MELKPSSVLVTGDFVLDHHIYEGRRHHYGDSMSPGVRVKRELGGAGLIHGLLRKLFEDGERSSEAMWTSRIPVLQPSTPEDFAAVDEAQHSYAFWRPFPRAANVEKQFWRVGKALGFGRARRDGSCGEWPCAESVAFDPRLVVLSDGGMDFRNAESCWPNKELGTAHWIILKMSGPVASGRLWEKVSREFSTRLVTVVAASELRKSSAHISRGLSWEATIEGLLNELRPGRPLASLSNCRHLVVSFGPDGALWLDQPSKRTGRAHVVYDPSTVEGEHERSADGATFGLLSCLTAAVTLGFTVDLEKSDLVDALERGLSAMRDLREKGHGPASEMPDGFPISRLAAAIQRPPYGYSRASFETPASESPGRGMRNWSLLLESQRGPHPVRDLGRLLVLRGPIALANLPHLKIGNLRTVDRREIESLRSLVQVIRSYQSLERATKPLSVGVFGPPGSGKSFAVAQIAKELLGEQGWMEFNLSQFDTPADLVGAFHQIRDRVLQGLLPVAFFDEFDARGYHWLQYLLAPMQDGKFQEGQITHTLGKCVFIFAGGTSWTFETFGPPEGEESEEQTNFRRAKGTDFKSRLDAYMDVVGPNRRIVSSTTEEPEGKSWELASGHRLAEDPEDICVSIRRALMIRAELRCSSDERIDLDDGLLHALLNVESFTHGSRSLGKVLQPFRAARPGPLPVSLLPPPVQLAMHVDVEEFFRLCAQPPGTSTSEVALTPDEVETVAHGVHETYTVLGHKSRWLNPAEDIEFEVLSDFLKESNRAAACRMPAVLALVGLRVVDGLATGEEEAAVRQHLEYHLDLLAEAEHEGWMNWHLDQGWRYARTRDNEQRLHPALLPFSQLHDIDKNKDRDSIRHYPDVVRLAGKMIEFVPERPGI